MNAPTTARDEQPAYSRPHLRLPSALHDDLRAVAADNRRSVNGEVVVAIERHVARERRAHRSDAEERGAAA